MKTLIKQKTAQHFIVFLATWYCGITILMPDVFVGLNLFNFIGILTCMGIGSGILAGFIEFKQAASAPKNDPIEPSVFDIAVSACGAIAGALLHHFYPGVLFPYLFVWGVTIALIQGGQTFGIDTRKFLVRWWFLDYSLKIFKHGRSVRASLTIFPLMVINGLFVAYDELNPWAFAVLSVALWFGFIYGRLHPITIRDWPRMTDYQKWQWGYYVMEETFFDELRFEWYRLDEKVDEWLDKKILVL